MIVSHVTFSSNFIFSNPCKLIYRTTSQSFRYKTVLVVEMYSFTCTGHMIVSHMTFSSHFILFNSMEVNIS